MGTVGPGFQARLETIHPRRIVSCAGGAKSMEYHTRALQSRDRPVPLVAGEQDPLRVLVTAEDPRSAAVRPFHARFCVDGTGRHVVDIPSKATSIPMEMLEHDLPVPRSPATMCSWALRWCSRSIRRARRIRTRGWWGGSRRRGAWRSRCANCPCSTSRWTPFLWCADPEREVVEVAEAMEEDPGGHRLLRDTRTLLPIGGIEMAAHQPVMGSSNTKKVLLDETKVRRAIEGGSRHYMGMMSGAVPGGGVASGPGRATFPEPYT